MRWRIKKFDVTSMKPHRVVYFIGRRGSGKSTLVEDVMRKMSDRIDVVLAMSPTFESVEMFRRHVPHNLVYNGYAPARVEQLISLQQVAVQEGRPRAAALMLDDCMYDRSVLNSTSMRNLHFNGRHLHICFLNSVQYLMDISPAIRTQVDYVFCLSEKILANKKKLHNFFFGVVPSFHDFCRLLDKCTENFSALVLDATSPTSDVENCLFWYRAEPPVAFRMCKPVYWKLSTRFSKDERDRGKKDSQGCAVGKSDGEVVTLQ